MPVKVSRGDRRIFFGAGFVFLLLTVGALIVTRGRGPQSDTPSTYSSGSGGAKVAFLLLAASGYEQVRWEKPLTDLPEGTLGTIILADPREAPTRAERARLEKFVRSGGQVIATGAFAGTFLPESHAMPELFHEEIWRQIPAMSPSAITRDAPEITLAPEAIWRGEAHHADLLYGAEDRVMVVKYHSGEGEVIWWASATPLTNAGLKEPGNLAFFLACVNEGGRKIVWDEYVHGYRETLGGSIAHSTARWVFLQVALLGLALLFTFSRRCGPVFFPAVNDVRLSPLEFVHTLGGIYQRAGASVAAVDIFYQRFRYWLTRRVGLASNATVAEMAAAASSRWNVQDPSFASTLAECEAARQRVELRPADALRLIQTLHRYAAQFKLYRLPGKEKS